ncbi:MAG: O-antigen ligase family protein [Holophagae bacterium]|nr:O-antigen ligase family protein [Holophagae bacterium]
MKLTAGRKWPHLSKFVLRREDGHHFFTGLIWCLIVLRSCSDWLGFLLRIPAGAFKINANYLINLLIIVMIAIWIFRKRKEIRIFPKKDQVVFLFGGLVFFLYVLGIPAALVHFGTAALPPAFRLIASWVLLAAISLFIINQTDSHLLRRMVIFIFLAHLAAGLLEIATGGVMFNAAVSGLDTRLEGFFSHGNSAGVFLAFLTGIILFDKAIFPIKWRYPLSVIALVELILTKSRSGFLLLILLAIWGVIFLIKKRERLILVLAVAVIAAALSPFLGKTFTSRWEHLHPGQNLKFLIKSIRNPEAPMVYSGNSLHWRFQTWALLAARTAEMNPVFGMGTGAEYIVNPYRTKSQEFTGKRYKGLHTHNYMVRLFMNNGLLGLLVFWGIALWLMTRKADKKEKWILAGLLMIGIYYQIPPAQTWIILFIYSRFAELSGDEAESDIVSS